MFVCVYVSIITSHTKACKIVRHFLQQHNVLFLDQINTSTMFMQKLVVKPDQLIKRRGKLGLVKVDASIAEVKEWLSQKMNEELQASGAQLLMHRIPQCSYMWAGWGSSRQTEHFHC